MPFQVAPAVHTETTNTIDVQSRATRTRASDQPSMGAAAPP